MPHPSGPKAASGKQYGVLVRLILWAALACASALPAQTATDGGIAGKAPVQAHIVARDPSTGVSREAASTQSGQFLLTHLPPGDYTVEITAPGLWLLRRNHVLVESGAITDVSSPIPPSISDPEFTPDADAPEESLPTYQGLAANANAFLVDGAATTESFTNTPTGSGSPQESGGEDDSDQGATHRDASPRSVRSASVPFTFARSSIREFHIAGERYSALFGGAPGGILHATTQRGGPTFHGQAFLYLRNSAFDAVDPYAIATTYTNGVIQSGPVKPHDARQQFGGQISGPILHNRLFFLAATDAQRRGNPAISSPQDTAFYTLTATQKALLANRGVHPSEIAAALTYLNSLTGTVPRRSDGDVNFLRLDHRAGNRATTTLDYNRVRWTQPAGALSAPVVSRARASLGSVTDRADAVSARNLTFLTPSLSNDLRARYSRHLRADAAQPPLPQEPAISPGGFAPEVAIAPLGLTFGTPSSLGRTAYPDERRLEFADLISLVYGREHIQLGMEAAFVHDFINALPNQEGAFRYDSGATNGRAGGLVDWITDYTFSVHAYPNGACPSITAAVHDFCFRTFTQSFGQQTVAFDTQEWAAYLQDDIRLLPTLTLAIGARYDYQLLPYPQRPNPALDNTFGPTASTSIFPEDRNNLGPRISLAWNPRAVTLRAGYGVFYGKVPGATLRAALLDTDLATTTTHIRITPTTEIACPQVQNQGFGYPCAFLTSPASALSNSTSAVAFSRRFRSPMVQQGSLTLARDLSGAIELSATYRISLDRQLPSSTDINIAPSTSSATYQLQGGTGTPGVRDGEIFPLPTYTTRILNTVGPVTAITSNANATYHGATFEARHTGPRLTFLAAFTFSRAIDNAPAQSAIPSQNAQLDPFTNRYDRGLSTLNFPLRLTAQVAWNPRIPTRNRTLRATLNGWTISPLFQWRSGAPYSLTLFDGTHLPGGRYTLNGSGGATYLPTVGRNTLRLPNATNLNLRVTRECRLHDNLHLELHAEAYNLPNHVNLSGVVQRAYLVGTPVAGITPLVFQNAANIATEGLNGQPFGAFTDSGTSTSRARALQFGLRLQF